MTRRITDHAGQLISSPIWVSFQDGEDARGYLRLDFPGTQESLRRGNVQLYGGKQVILFEKNVGMGARFDDAVTLAVIEFDSGAGAFFAKDWKPTTNFRDLDPVDQAAYVSYFEKHQ